MADISGYLTNIKNAARGEDVRDSIINALKKINQDNPANVQPLNVTANGTYSGQGGIVYNPVTVNVPEGASQALGLSSIQITENGEYTPDDGEAYSKIIVDVPQIGMDLMTDPKVIYLEEGAKSYYALDDGYDGYTQVDVVSGGGGGGAATYTVNFYAADRTTILETVVGVPFGGGAVYHKAQPTSSGMRFVGWTPNPLNVKANMNCYPRFENLIWDETQILDDWVTIAKNVQTNPDAYPIGAWKMLDLLPLPITEQNDNSTNCIRNAANNTNRIDYIGNHVKMTLIAKGVDPIEGENGYANTTWLSTTTIDSVNGCKFYQYIETDTFNWINSNLRKFLQDQFTTKVFPQELIKYVKRVIKKSAIRETSGSAIILHSYPSIEWFWIPSSREMVGTCTNMPTNLSYVGDLNAALETDGPAYNYFGERVSGISDYNETAEYRKFYPYGLDPSDPNNRRAITLRTSLSGMIFGNSRSGVHIDNNGLCQGAAENSQYNLLGFCL